MFGGEHDTISKLNETHITLDMLQDAKGEGIYFYIQTTNCRRLVLCMVFQNALSGGLISYSFELVLTLPKMLPRLCVVTFATQRYSTEFAPASLNKQHVNGHGTVSRLSTQSAPLFMDGGER
jgi:hypothetical protein